MGRWNGRELLPSVQEINLPKTKEKFLPFRINAVFWSIFSACFLGTFVYYINPNNPHLLLHIGLVMVWNFISSYLIHSN